MTIAAEGISAWIPTIAALAGIGGALGSQWLSHHFTAERERKAASEKLQREQYFIATELVFQLERFGEECVPPATDYGDAEDGSGLAVLETSIPGIEFSGVKGDWRSLPSDLMYQIRELETMIAESRNVVSTAFDDADPPDFIEGFFAHRQQAVRLGIRAFILAARLRKLCKMPAMKGAGNSWSAPRHLWSQYREQRAILFAARRTRVTRALEITRLAHEKRHNY